MQQGGASLNAGDYDSALQYFKNAYAISRTNNALFWEWNASGYNCAKNKRWDAAANMWRKCVERFPATAAQLNPKIAMAERAAKNKSNAEIKEFFDDLTEVVKFLVKVAPFLE